MCKQTERNYINAAIERFLSAGKPITKLHTSAKSYTNSQLRAATRGDKPAQPIITNSLTMKAS